MDESTRGKTGKEQIEHILRRIRQLTRGIDQHSRFLVREWGVTVPQLLCLRAVVEAPETTATGVARGINLNPSTVTGILDRLEKRGWVTRNRSARDRRVVTVSATAAGRDFLERAPAPLQDRFANGIARLPRRELEGIVRALDLLAELLGVEEVEAGPVLDGESSS